MHAVDRVAGKALEQIVLQHGQRAADAFLAGLEDEVHRAVEVARLRQVARGAEQHRGVAVMAAGVHLAVVAAAIREVVGLVDRQRVHVGAQADRGLAVAGAQHADHAGVADAAVHLDAPFLQLARDQVGGAMLLQAEFRMGVDVLADGGEFGVVAADLVDRRCHEVLLSVRRL